MPKTGTKIWFVFPDIHVPEHDEQALACALKAHKSINPHHSLFLGDLLDCGLFSAHRKRVLSETIIQDYQETELTPAREILDTVQKGTKEKTFLLAGNHEERIERWATNGGQIERSLFSLLDPSKTLSLTSHHIPRKKFQFLPYTLPNGGHSHVRLAKDLVAVHGWSWAKHAAHIHLEKSRSQSIIFGHSHRHQVASSRDPWNGRVIKAFNPGTLSKLQPLYMVGGSPTDWSHGFSIVYVGRTSWTEYCITIDRGCCVLPDGREIRI